MSTHFRIFLKTISKNYFEERKCYILKVYHFTMQKYYLKYFLSAEALRNNLYNFLYLAVGGTSGNSGSFSDESIQRCLYIRTNCIRILYSRLFSILVWQSHAPSIRTILDRKLKMCFLENYFFLPFMTVWILYYWAVHFPTYFGIYVSPTVCKWKR